MAHVGISEYNADTMTKTKAGAATRSPVIQPSQCSIYILDFKQDLKQEQ